jgi:hypothetical protein
MFAFLLAGEFAYIRIPAYANGVVVYRPKQTSRFEIRVL